MLTTILFPNVLWATLINGVAIGQMVSIAASCYTVLMGGYGWQAKYVSFVNMGQIVVSFIALPLLGFGSDHLIRYMAKHRKGIHQPETRLLPLFLPLMIGILALMLYGEAGAHPHKLSWGAVVFAVPAQYFSFTAVNLVTISYLVDSYPTCIAPVVILLCVVRGFIGFGIGYTVTQFVDKAGYVGCFGTYSGLYAALAIWAVILYFTGNRIREYCSRFLPKE